MSRSAPFEVVLPAWFDHANAAHVQAVTANLAAQGYQGVRLESMDPTTRKATATIELPDDVALLAVDNPDHKELPLPASLRKPPAAAQAVVKYEEKYPGFTVTAFDPFGGTITLDRLTVDERRARGQAADALGFKPWDVKVTKRRGGGYTLTLPQYIPSKHDAKLDELASVMIGKPGWYAEGDPSTNVVQIIPGDLCTFEDTYPFDFAYPDRTGMWSLPLGIALGGRGVPNADLDMDLSIGVGISLVGLSGSGKSFWVNLAVFTALAKGWQVAVANDSDKRADYFWCKPFLRENGWGCDDKDQALAVMRLVSEEGARRANLGAEHGWHDWDHFPPDVQQANPPILLVVDEAQSLVQGPSKTVIAAMPKDSEERAAAEQEAAVCAFMVEEIRKITAKQRAWGIRMLLVTQYASATTGIPPAIRMQFPNKIILGPRATEAERGMALKAPKDAPEVPRHIQYAPGLVSKGVGVAELEGRQPVVFKGRGATAAQFTRELERRHTRRAVRVEPTLDQKIRLVPGLTEAFSDDGPPPSALDRGGFGGPDGRDVAARDALKGAAAASHALAMEAALAAKRRSTPDPVAG